MVSKLSATFSELLDAALALPVEQRMAWLDQLGEEFASQKPRLRALIARSLQAESSELLATLPKLHGSDDANVARFDNAAHAGGSVVGPYELARCLGVGAMGAVWLARRTDGVAPREVALKFAHLAPLRSDLRARLAREEQLLAALDHPNIARLYAAGVTDQGQPYLVLEYVAGLALDAYCRAQQPTVAERLRLFLQMARAVAHAHDCQIVHRDLKPANVMVTPDGTVRLLDFGIGKLLIDDLPPELQLSRLTGQPLTPAYASPEQVVGSAVGLPSDVYSLGVVLYELLTGVRPYVYQPGSNRALREAIVEVMPPALRERIDERALGPQMTAELDAIVRTALQKHPARRYPTAREFADAIEALLLTALAPR
jgi:eukaryotic-like serine/threonine-protein kinase